MKYLAVALLILVSGCSMLKPEVDECANYDAPAKTSYCYLSKEVTALRLATAQSLNDGAITREEAIRARDILSEADGYLDIAEKLIVTGDEVKATNSLTTVRALLVELR